MFDDVDDALDNAGAASPEDLAKAVGVAGAVFEVAAEMGNPLPSKLAERLYGEAFNMEETFNRGAEFAKALGLGGIPEQSLMEDGKYIDLNSIDNIRKAARICWRLAVDKGHVGPALMLVRRWAVGE